MSKLVANITNSPRSIKGLKPIAYWCYRSDVALTIVGNTVTNVSIPILGVISGCKFFMNSGSEIVTAEDNFSGFKQKFSATINDGGATLDEMDDIVLFVESMCGTKYVLGAKYGLWKVSQSQMANDNLATTAVEFASREGMEETNQSYLLDYDISGIPTIDEYEVITGLTIADGSVTPQNITLSTTLTDKTSVVLPDGTALTGEQARNEGSGYDYTGVAGAVKIFISKDEDLLYLTTSKLNGVLNTKLTGLINIAGGLGITGVIAPNCTELQATGCTNLTSINVPKAKTVIAEGCALTKEAIGDFLYLGARVNNPTYAGDAYFLGGNDIAENINSYLQSAYSIDLTQLSTILNSWSITVNY